MSREQSKVGTVGRKEEEKQSSSEQKVTWSPSSSGRATVT